MKNFLRKLAGLSSKSLEKGFSLAETMVAVAILGIVITATLSQLELSSKSSLDMAADAEINNVTNKIIATIGTTSVCRDNFGGKTQDNSYDFIVDSNGDKLIIKGASTGAANSIKVLNIETKRISDNEMSLVLSFEKKRSSVKNIFAAGPRREIPINTILDTTNPTLIQDCFANYDLVIRTAIQQSCTGLASKYNPNINLPYGACEHSVRSLVAGTPITCPTSQFLKEVRTTSGEIEYVCGKFTEDCPVGQAVKGFNSAGVVQCDYIFPTCAPGDVVMEVGGAHVCRKLDCGPPQPVLSAFRGFSATGAIQCTPITTASPCGNGKYATQISSDGEVTCANFPFNGGVCPIGKYINGVDGNGNVICDTYIQVPFTCPAGQAITGIKSDGVPDCEIIDATLKCGGSTHTYNDCVWSTGVVQNSGTSTSHCLFNQSSCPAGWTRCENYGAQWQSECRDSSNTFYCNEWTQVRGVTPVGGNGNNLTNAPLSSVQCNQWVGSPGTQGRCDVFAGGPVATTIQRTVGCK